MTALIPIALFGWPLVALALFAGMRPRDAVIATVVSGWLFLPSVSIPVHGFIDMDRRASISLGTMLAAVLLDTQGLLRFRPRWIDVPMLLWCVAPVPASLTNGLGLYDGLASGLQLLAGWGLPWFLGRVYLSDLSALRAYCRGLFIGGLVYAPLCMWEVRMSPTLHASVYGDSTYFGVIAYAQDLGNWGSRPSVFLKNPLELGMFMTCACLCGLALSWTRRDRKMLGIPTGVLATGLIFVALMCKNLGATVLLVGGGVALAAVRFRGSRIVVYSLLVVSPLYVVVRSTGAWNGAQAVEVASWVHAERAQSFAFRLEMESLLVDKALERPIFGWGGWGRSRVYNRLGEDISIVDGLWILTLGMYGMFGLGMMVLATSMPILFGFMDRSRAILTDDRFLPAAIALVLLLLWGIDNLANGFTNSLVLLGAGGAASIGRIALASDPARSRRGAPKLRLQEST